MPAIALRQDFDAAQPRSLARARRDARQVRRLLALAAVYDGASRGESAALGGMDRQLLRDWALRFNAEGPGGLIDRKAPGARSKLTPEQLSGCRPWRAWSRMARSRPSTGWSAGG
jgi:transposase